MATGGVYGLRKVQLGKETTKGTAVAATEILLCTAEVNANYDIYQNVAPFGIMAENAGPAKVVSKAVDVMLNLDGITYEQLAWLLSMALRPVVTAGAGPYTHTYDPSMAALAVPDSMTLELRHTDGTDNEDLRIEYLMARKLSFTINEKQQLQCKADCFGRQVTDNAISAATLPANLEHIVCAEGNVYLNDSWAAADAGPPGGGSWSGKLVKANVEITTGLEPFWGVSGNPYFTRHKETGKKGFKASITAVLDGAAAGATTQAERTKAAAVAQRFMTLYFAGTSARKLQLTLAGRHEKGEFAKIGEQEGQDIMEMSIVGWYDATAAKLWKAIVTNNDAAAL